METSQMLLLRAVAGYRMTDHKRDEDVKEELKITDVSSVGVIKTVNMLRQSENKTS
jgi:hypothetical protein